MRTRDVKHSGNRDVEVAMVDGQAAEARRDCRHAVVGALARDDLLLRRAAACVVVVVQKLDDRIVRLGAGVRVEHALQPPRREFDQLFGKLDCRSVRLVAEQVIKRQLGKLASGGIDETLLAEAQRHAP